MDTPIISGGNVLNYQFTSSVCFGIQRAVQIGQWCISCGNFYDISLEMSMQKNAKNAKKIISLCAA